MLLHLWRELNFPGACVSMALSQHPDAAQLPHHQAPSSHQQSATAPPLSPSLHCPCPHSVQGLLQDLLQCLHCPSDPPSPLVHLTCMKPQLLPCPTSLVGMGIVPAGNIWGLVPASPSSLQQRRKVRNKADGATATVLGTLASPFTSCLSPVLLLPSLGTMCQLPRQELSQHS